MSNDDSNHKSAEDIITFIGVPLAVLGVLPILYNTLATLAALSKIKRMLRHGKMTALTRSDIVNRVIEVELPRYAVQPWDRFDHRGEYWQISRQPSEIPGGSWTTFNWKTNTIGIKTQRVEYADQLRQPQAEVEFHELVAYLLDLGAVPDPHGWRLLRSTGLWTPTGCALMKSPDNTRVALAIAPLDDSDGHLSLKVTWEPMWTTRDATKLPPYWVSLPPPPTPPPADSNESDAKSSHENGDEIQSGEEPHGVDVYEEGSEVELSKSQDEERSSPRPSHDAEAEAKKIARTSITCQISVDGLMSALSQESGLTSTSTVNVHSLPMDHLRAARPGMVASTTTTAAEATGRWFASAATAYGTSSQTVLWNYKVPDELLAFARRDTVPCGVLELLGIVGADATPEWESEASRANHEFMDDHQRFVRQSQEQRMAMSAEARMDPAAKAIAVRQRMEREAMQRINDMQDRSRRDARRRETRRHDALQSPKWDNKLVAEHSLSWLRARGSANDIQFHNTTTTTTDDSNKPEETPATKAKALRDAVGTLLHRMVTDSAFAGEMGEVLEVWRAWADNGGMRGADLDLLFSKVEIFVRAALLVALVKDATGHEGSSLSLDLQECLRMWRVVRLG